MAKYVSTPQIIEADQFHSFHVTPWPKGVEAEGTRCYVTTIHLQKAYLDDGDYVITEPDGIHHYPCKPDIFEKKYKLIP